jgi:predicted CoA-binding protein
VFGTHSYDSLEDVEEEIDVVDVFRNARHAVEVVRSAIAAGQSVIWFQLGTQTDEAVELALENGLSVVTDRCIAVEVAKLPATGAGI